MKKKKRTYGLVVGVAEEGGDLALGVVDGAGAAEGRVVAGGGEEGVAGVEAVGLAGGGGLREERVEEGRRHDAGHGHVVGRRHVAGARLARVGAAVVLARPAVPVLAAALVRRAPAVLRARREDERRQDGGGDGELRRLCHGCWLAFVRDATVMPAASGALWW